MSKLTLNEELGKMRKILGLSENYDIDSSYEDSVMGDVPGETVGPEDEQYDDLIEFDIPNWALGALINGDESDLTDEEQEKLNAFVNDVVSKYGNANFMTPDEDEMDLGFLPRNDIDNLGGDCSRLLIRPTSGMDEEVDEGIGMFHDPIGFKKPELSAIDKMFTKEYKGNGIYVIYKNGEEVKTIEGEGNANAWINDQKRNMNNNADGMDENELDGGDIEEDSVKISMLVMSKLSDMQEENPELRDKINYIKSLIMKMNDKTEINLSDLENK